MTGLLLFLLVLGVVLFFMGGIADLTWPIVRRLPRRPKPCQHDWRVTVCGKSMAIRSCVRCGTTEGPEPYAVGLTDGLEW